MKQAPTKIVRNRSIAEKRLQGATYRELSKEFGLGNSSLHHILNKDENVKDIIETGTRQLVALVPKAVDNFYQFLNSSNEKIRYDASKDILTTNRIMDTRTVSQFIQNIYQDNRQLITSDVQQLMLMLSGQAVDHVVDDDIIDAELIP